MKLYRVSYSVLIVQEGRTALALASWEGHLSVVQVLVARGIDPNIQDQVGPSSSGTFLSCVVRLHKNSHPIRLEMRIEVNPVGFTWSQLAAT